MNCGERLQIEKLFRGLSEAPTYRFPELRSNLEAPKTKGIYVIYNMEGTVCHVGAAPRGKGGLKQRLSNHLATQSSFTRNYKPLRKKGRNLRGKYRYQCLEVPDQRCLILLEALAIGRLCPAHIGLHELKK